MKYNAFRKMILKKHLYDNASGTGSDNTTDAEIVRNPNDYLAPIAGNDIVRKVSVAALVLLAVWVIIYVGKDIFKQIN